MFLRTPDLRGMASGTLVDTLPGAYRIEDAVRALFAGDGRIYLVTGFLSGTAYRSRRNGMQSFLDRSPDSELIVLVDPSLDRCPDGHFGTSRASATAGRFGHSRTPTAASM